MGVSTQRGTGTFWEAKSGKVLNNFVTWQDIRCKKFVDEINGALATKIIRVQRFIPDPTNFAHRLLVFYPDSWSLIKPAQRNSSTVLHFVTRIRKFLAASVIKFREGMACVRLAWLMGILDCKEKCLNGEVVWGNIDSWSGSATITPEVKSI